MRSEDEDAFGERLNEMYVFYRQTDKLTPTMIEIWWRLMQPFTLEQFGSAMTAWMMGEDCKFPPMPGDLKKLIDGSQDEAAGNAWRLAREAVRRVGHYQSVAFDDPKIAAAIEAMGGWQRLNALDQDQMVWAEKEFKDHFKGIKEVRHCGVLWGLSDAQNAANGLTQHVQQPVLMGNQMAALNNANAARQSLPQGKSLGDVVKALSDRRFERELP